MIDRLVFLTKHIKKMLIAMGCELPPVADMFNNKMKQIDLDFRQMAHILTGKYFQTLYENASHVFTFIMTEQYNIRTLKQLLDSSERVYTYIANY
jgi:HEPN domain-containing protein